MYPIKKIPILLLIIFSTASALAQNNSKVKNLLNDISNNYRNKKNTYFKFSYSTDNGETTQTGIFYNSGKLYKVKIMDTEQIFDGKKIYNINNNDQEITITKVSDNKQTLSPLYYLETYKKGYHLSYVRKSGYTDIIKMTPTKKSSIKYILIHINTTKKSLSRIEQHHDNKKSTVIIHITDYRENQKLNSELFRFNKNLYKNYLITEI